MGAKIKPHQNLDETFKKHSYPGLLNFVKNCNSINDLEYLKKDYSGALHTMKIIKERISICEKMGECNKTKNYYKGIKKNYIDKGITVKDVDQTIKWFETIYIKTINDKLKSLK